MIGEIFIRVRNIFSPNYSGYKVDIIPDKAIKVMSKERLIIERIRSKRRFDEYYYKTVNSIRSRRYLLISFELIILFILFSMYKWKYPIDIKLGDLIVIIIILLNNLYWSVWVLNRKKVVEKEEPMLNMTITALKKALKNGLKREWNYLDRQNINMAAGIATLFTMLMMVFIMGIISIINAENENMYLMDYLSKQYSVQCVPLKLESLHFNVNSCDLFVVPSLVPFLFFVFTYEIASILISPPGSGKFYRNQALKDNYISSVYLDNISISSLNPNQNEAN